MKLFILFAYRSSVQSSLKYSPYWILFGREPQVPGSLSAQPSEHISRKDYADEVAAGLEAMRIILQKNLQEAQERQKRHYDRKHPAPKFEINQLVWLQTVRKGPGSKLQPKWSGPYVIAAKPTPSDSAIRPWRQPDGKRVLVHDDRLKPCHAPWQMPPVDDDDDEDLILQSHHPVSAVDSQRPLVADLPVGEPQNNLFQPLEQPVEKSIETQPMDQTMQPNGSSDSDITVNSPLSQQPAVKQVPTIPQPTYAQPSQQQQPQQRSTAKPPSTPSDQSAQSQKPTTMTVGPKMPPGSDSTATAPTRTRGNALRANPSKVQRYQPEDWLRTSKK